MRDWWYWNKYPVIAVIILIISLIALLWLVDYEHKNKVKVYQDCMADIHNVYACTVYSEQFSEYIPQ